MHTVIVTNTIQAAAERIWQALDDYGNIAVFHPFVARSRITNGQPTGLGAERVCSFYDGSQVRETITRYLPGQGYSVELADFSMPLKQGTVHLDVKALDTKRSQVTVCFEFEPKFGVLGWLMAQTLIKPKLKQVSSQLMQGLADHLRTGKVVGENGVLLEMSSTIP